MRFYQATRFLFPRSFELRMLTICFLAVHVPLIAFVVFSAAIQEWRWDSLLVLLLATLVGTGAGLAAIHALLAPLASATDMLRQIQAGERVNTVPSGGNDLVGRLLQGTAQAANEAAARSDRLTVEAERDPLTGLLNRRGFFARATVALDAQPQAIMALIDLDHFKSVNDRFGHATGDRLLQMFAERLGEVVRRSDICGRWGGEEFAVLLPGAAVSQARDVMQRLRESMKREPLAVEATVTFSCGLAQVREAASINEAASRADEALYEAKQHGRDRVHSAPLTRP